MKYEDFEKFIQQNCMYETIYRDTDGRTILVIQLLDAWVMVNRFTQQEKANEATNTTKETKSR